MAPSSSEIRDMFAEAKTTAEVDDVAWGLTKKGYVPDFIARDFWKWVTVEENGHRLETLWPPTYYALGDDDDPWFVDRVSEAFAQNVADRFDALIPTWKLLQAAQKQSSLKIPYIDVKTRGVALKDIESPRASEVANAAIREAYAKRGKDYGDELCLTWAKSYVIAPDMDGSHLCIGGGSYDTSGTAIVQPPCSPHIVSYADYSQRIALVSRKCKLDGEDADLRDDVALSKDPKIWGLMNGTGKRFDPVFPNTGAAGGKSKDSYVVAKDGEPLGGKGGAVSTGQKGIVQRVREKVEAKASKGTIGGAAVGAAAAWLVVGFRPVYVVLGAGVGALAGDFVADKIRDAWVRSKGLRP